MKVTKYGHACLLIEENGVEIIIDPGMWNPTPDARGVKAVLITHEHQDHADIDQIKAILEKNPGAGVITHAGVGRVLDEAGIPYTTIEEGQTIDIGGVSIESFGHDHAIIYGNTPPCQNTGFLIAGRLFHPGDAVYDVPTKPVEILALPTGGPWMKMAEAIDYAKKVAPKVIIPIHDALYTEDVQRGMIPRMIGGNLQAEGIEFRDMANGSVEEF